jgi:hypothetical protein
LGGLFGYRFVMLDLLAVIPSRTPSFNRKWLSRVFADVKTACLLLGHPSTEVLIDPRRNRISIRQDGAEVPLEARSYVYLPSSCERQHTVLAKVRANRYADFVAREWDVVTQFLEDRLAAKGKWVNSPLSARRAANKLVQLLSARARGLAMPLTLVTNNPLHAIRVLPPGTSRGLSKPIGESGNITADWMAPASFFTRDEILADPASIQVAPGCFQRYIPAELELRTYVFGSHAISIAIRPRGKTSTPDLTCQDLEEADFSATTDFQNHESKLVALVKDLGLSYAAVDSLVAKGRCYFLEVNPNGGWRWLPRDLQTPLDREFRRLVLS